MGDETDTRWWAEVGRRLFECQEKFHESELDEEDWPREPSSYTITNHFMEKKKEDKRHIEGRYIKECIEEGDFFPAHETKGIFMKEFSGVAFYFVAGSPEEGNPYFEAVTMYPWVKSKGEALVSGEWTKEQLEDIRELNKDYMNQEGRREFIQNTNFHS